MKTLNKFRATDKFCIIGGDVAEITRIAVWAAAQKYQIVALAGGHAPCEFTVRVVDQNGDLVDLFLKTYGTTPRVEEQMVIAIRLPKKV